MSEITIAGEMFWVFIIWFSLIIINAFVNILSPNWLHKRIRDGKSKIPNDNIIRGAGAVSLLIFSAFILWFLGYLT